MGRPDPSMLHQIGLPGLKTGSGASSQRIGAAFEVAIEQGARAAGVELLKIPAPTQILGTAPARKGRRADPRVVLARLESPMAPDWLDHPPGGRAVALEGKTASPTQHPTSWALPERLRGKQGEVLERWDGRGAVSGVVLRRLSGWTPATKTIPPRRVEGADYFIPWPECDPRPAKMSWKWADLERWAVPKGRGWWEVLEDWERYRVEGW